MPKYYGGHDGMLLQLASMSQLGCSVIVAGRVVTDDQGKSSFKTFEDVEVPDAITDLVSDSLACVLSAVCSLLWSGWLHANANIYMPPKCLCPCAD